MKMLEFTKVNLTEDADPESADRVREIRQPVAWTENDLSPVDLALGTAHAIYGRVSPDGIIEFMLGRIFEELSMSAFKLRGQPIVDLVFWQTSEANFARFRKFLTNARHGHSAGGQIEFRLAHRLQKTIDLKIVPVMHGAQVDHLLLIGTELTTTTPERRSELESLTAAIAQAHELERRARDEAEEANRTKDAFLAFVSHELRSPLNAILGWTKILQTRPIDDDTRQHALATIERSALAQAKLISDLVDSSRIASGRIKLEMAPVNLVEVIKTVCAAHQPAAENKQINLVCVNDVTNATVFGDAVRLGQVFSNLVGNAVKFTPNGGRVGVSLAIADGQKVTVLIEDTGAGIEQTALGDIFRQFKQSGTESKREAGGLGLGLSIVRTLVEKHGGTVSAHSPGIGLGALFVVTLPVFANPLSGEHRVSSDPRQAVDLTGLRILLVEDDRDSREVLQVFLEQHGADVTSVAGSDEAVYLLDTGAHQFHLLISDLAMPNEDGYEFIRRLRSRPAASGGLLPAIALSAFSSPEIRERALAQGFQHYHTKPFRPTRLIEEILTVTGIAE